MSADPSHSNTVFTNDVEFGHVTGFDVEDFDDMGGFDVLGSSQMEAPHLHSHRTRLHPRDTCTEPLGLQTISRTLQATCIGLRGPDIAGVDRSVTTSPCIPCICSSMYFMDVQLEFTTPWHGLLPVK